MRHFIIITVLTVFSVLFSGPGKASMPKDEPREKVQKKAGVKKKKKVYYGTASYYSSSFRGRKTANGAAYRHRYMTAACNVLPLGSWVRITNLKNKKSIVVQINDRMHSRNRRIVDMSRSCAVKLGFVKQGVTRVKVEALGKKPPR